MSCFFTLSNKKIQKVCIIIWYNLQLILSGHVQNPQNGTFASPCIILYNYIVNDDVVLVVSYMLQPFNHQKNVC